MINITVFFKNHLDTPHIGDDKLRKFTENHLQRMTANNPGGIYATLITDTAVVYTNYFGSMTDELTNSNIKEGKTVTVNLAVAAFKKEVSREEGLIRSKWGVGSPQYQEFYPQGVSQYTNASLENIEMLMVAFVNAATAHVADLGAPFVTKFTTLKNNFSAARTDQLFFIGLVEGKKTATSGTRDSVEVQVMKNILIIASNNVGNTSIVEDYFDQSFLEGATKKTLSGPVLASSDKNIDQRTYTETQLITLRNPGASKLKYCIALTASDTCGSGIDVNPGEQLDVTASQLGDVSLNHFLNVTNTEAIDGEFSVTIEL